MRIEDILSSAPQKKYPICIGGGNLSISKAAKKAEEFTEVQDEISNQLKDTLPTFLKKYKKLINFVIDKENAEETSGSVREQARQLQEEATEIKKLNQLLMPEKFKRRKLNRHLLHYSQNRGRLPKEDWDEVQAADSGGK